jgi:HemY protein
MRRLINLLLFILKAAIVIGIGLWLYAHPGTVYLEWQDYAIETSVGFTAVILAIVIFIFALLYHGWRTLLAWPRLWRKQRQVKSLELGYKALNKGMLAVAAGDGTMANKQTKRALALLPDIALSHLLAAQAAQLNHDDVAADTHLAKLMLHPDGQLFAMRGQLTRALARDDRTEALRLSRVAYQQQSDQPWIIDTAVQMEARQQNWLQVEKILRQALKLKSEHSSRWEKDLAACLVCLSDSLRLKNDSDGALDCIREAVKRQPSWTPATTRLAQIWTQKTYRRRAQKVLLNAWELAPHPELVDVWVRIMGTERATDNTTTVERLVSSNPDNAEAALAMSQAFAQAELWGVARQHALRALEYRADRRSYRQLADIEQQDPTDSAQYRFWLDKAQDAPSEAQWLCHTTNEIFPQWQPLNRQGHFNTIQWQIPTASLPNALVPIAAVPLIG